MSDLVVDCRGVTSCAELWRRYVETGQIRDPATFGRNLDAFWDAIERGGPGRPTAATVTFLHSEELAALRMNGGGSFLEALRAISQDATVIDVRLA
jgi:hypothetical protein